LLQDDADARAERALARRGVEAEDATSPASARGGPRGSRRASSCRRRWGRAGRAPRRGGPSRSTPSSACTRRRPCAGPARDGRLRGRRGDARRFEEFVIMASRIGRGALVIGARVELALHPGVERDSTRRR
jgi:hypothetical protein